MRLIPALVLAAACLAAAPALGHDMWIAPSTFDPQVGGLVKVHLRVGHPAKEAEPVPRQPQRIVRFTASGPGGEAPILGQDGLDPAGLLRPAEPGLHVLAYESNHALLELAGERFESYLAEEGLERIQALRAERGENADPGRELYSRGLKSLLVVGPTAGEARDRALGLAFELVLEGDLQAARPGAPLSVRVLFGGWAVADVLVEGVLLDGTGEAIHSRSDGSGRATFVPPRGGAWLLAAVHMIEAPAGSGVDWESFWASLTFSLPDE